MLNAGMFVVIELILDSLHYCRYGPRDDDSMHARVPRVLFSYICHN